MNTENSKDIDRILDDDERIEAALQEAVRDALRRHKQAGNPVAECEDGRIILLSADEIEVVDG